MMMKFKNILQVAMMPILLFWVFPVLNSAALSVPGMIKKAGCDTMPAGEIVKKLAFYMLDHQAPNPSIGYTGQTLEFVHLYMKQGEGRPARIFEGAQGIEALKRPLQ